jgi:hypothetical protein
LLAGSVRDVLGQGVKNVMGLNTVFGEKGWGQV